MHVHILYVCTHTLCIHMYVHALRMYVCTYVCMYVATYVQNIHAYMSTEVCKEYGQNKQYIYVYKYVQYIFVHTYTYTYAMYILSYAYKSSELTDSCCVSGDSTEAAISVEAV